MFTIDDAMNKLNKFEPELKPEGYWQRGSTFIIRVNTSDPALKVCNYFAVPESGEIRPTNPVKSHLLPDAMTEL